MNQDLGQAHLFLNILSSDNANWHFQTFSDTKGSQNVTSTPEGPFDDLMADTLKVANSHGAGIFAAINTHQHKKRRTKKTTEKINAVFCDFDDEKTAWDAVQSIVAVLPATMVVESSPGKYHVYYVLSGNTINVADFSRWQRHLAKTFGSDPKIIDPSRVMRLPGYVHQKGEPFLTRIVPELTTKKKFSVDTLVSAFYGGRNNWLTSNAGALRAGGAGKDEILASLEIYNNQLTAPLDEDELVLIAGSMEVYEPDPQRAVHHQALQSARNLNLDVDKSGMPIPSMQNTFKVVGHERFMQFNTMTSQVEVVSPVPWPRTTNQSGWTDIDTVNFLSYLITKYGAGWPRSFVEMAIDKTASENTYDPLVIYLESLKWDNKPRVTTALHNYLEVDNSPYSRAVSESLFVGAVKRALVPGCKHDTMVVLVGEEGSGKSKFCSTIAKYTEFFTDSLGDLRNKDSVLNMQGRWIVEFGELKSLQGVSAEHTKAFVSAQVDNVRLPFGKRTQSFPRRCVFIGTTNNSSFITDTGTNRRMLPIMTPMSEESNNVMDYKKLENNVDQLWAEAVHMYKDGHDATMPAEVMAEAMGHRMSNTECGGYSHDILTYVNDDSLADKLEYFIPRDFYLAVVEGASREKWLGADSRLHKQIFSAAKKMLPSAEWEFNKYKIAGVTVRAWRRRNG